MISRIPRFVGAFAGALLVSGAAVAVTAEASGLASPPSAAAAPKAAATAPSDCQAFLGYFAANLHSTPEQVAAAYQDAIGKSLDAAVQRGDLTAAAAQTLRSKLAKSSACSGEIGHLKANAEHGARLDTAAAVAAALEMTPDALKAARKAGSSVQELAAKQGITESAFEAAVTANLTAQADQALAAGKTTKVQHDAVVARIPKEAKHLWMSGQHHTSKPAKPVA